MSADWFRAPLGVGPSPGARDECNERWAPGVGLRERADGAHAWPRRASREPECKRATRRPDGACKTTDCCRVHIALQPRESVLHQKRNSKFSLTWLLQHQFDPIQTRWLRARHLDTSCNSPSTHTNRRKEEQWTVKLFKKYIVQHYSHIQHTQIQKLDGQHLATEYYYQQMYIDAATT